MKTALVLYSPEARTAHIKAHVDGDLLHATRGATYQEAIGYAVLWACGQGGFDRVIVEQM